MRKLIKSQNLQAILKFQDFGLIQLKIENFLERDAEPIG